jgi:hypothetical protein
LALRDDVVQPVVNDFSSGGADDVADKKNFHSKGPISLLDGMRRTTGALGRTVHFAVRC